MVVFRRLDHHFYSTQLQNVFYYQEDQDFAEGCTLPITTSDGT